MKGNSKRFLALLLSVSMVSGPTATVYADVPDTVAVTQEGSAPETQSGEDAADTADTADLSAGQETPSGEPKTEDEKQTETEEQPSEILPGEMEEDMPEEEQPEEDESSEKQPEEESAAASDEAAAEVQDAVQENVTPAQPQEVTTAPVLAPDTDLSAAPEVTGDAGVEVRKADGSVFKMFVIKNSEVTKKGDKLEVAITTDNTSFDKLYLGNVSDAVREPVIQGIQKANGGFTFSFEVDGSLQGQSIPVVLGKTNGSWYTSQELVLYLPGGENETRKYRKMNVTTDAPMWVLDPDPSATYAMIDQDFLLQLVIGTRNSAYTRMYLGTAEELQDMSSATYVNLFRRGGQSAFIIGNKNLTDMGTTIPFLLYNTKTGEWSDKTYHLYLPEASSLTEPYTDTAEWDAVPTAADPFAEQVQPPKTDQTPVITPTPEPGDKVPQDGIYRTTAETNTAMFRAVDVELTARNGKMTALVTLSGTGYDYLYMGTAAEADAAEKTTWIPVKNSVTYTDSETGAQKTGYQYEIPVSALDQALNVASHSAKQDKWYDRTIRISSSDLKKIGDIPASQAPADGIYSTTAETNAAMFRAVDVELTAKSGKMTALVTLSGTGYDYLYMGTAADAAKAEKTTWIPVKNSVVYTDSETGVQKTGYQYEMPVAALDQTLTVASHSAKQDKWYDRTIAFSSENLKKKSDLPSEQPGGDTKPDVPSVIPPTVTPSPTQPPVDTTPDKESSYESDTSGSTSKVDSATTLEDGVYTPDGFSWSGGTGRVNITCSKITISHGQAYATIVFSSRSYAYVKANGNKYLGTPSGSGMAFTIPVELNRNNAIIGMTTKMSAAHEISYSIYVYLAAAKGGAGAGAEAGSNEKLDEEAPQIIGLEYQSETKLEYADYFKLYHYDQGITLLEIDMTKDTARDPEKQKEEAEKDALGEENAEEANGGQTADPASEATLTDENGEEIKTENEKTAELYQGNVVKYLIVPEEAEVPVGLEKDMIVISLPADRAYVASDAVLELLSGELKAEEYIAASGMDRETCKVESIGKAMEEEKVIFAGTYTDPDYKELVKSACNLAILPAELLPREEEEDAKEHAEESSEEETEAADEKQAVNGIVEEEKLTVEEQTERLKKISELFAVLEVPVLIDRSTDEKTELGKAEWIKVYGALFGYEKEAEKIFDAAVEAEKAKTK